MDKLASYARLGIPHEMTLTSGDHTIELKGYIYEPFYEYFSATSKIVLDGECLYGEDSRNVAAYRNETYSIGKFNTLGEAILEMFCYAPVRY